MAGRSRACASPPVRRLTQSARRREGGPADGRDPPPHRRHRRHAADRKDFPDHRLASTGAAQQLPPGRNEPGGGAEGRRGTSPASARQVRPRPAGTLEPGRSQGFDVNVQATTPAGLSYLPFERMGRSCRPGEARRASTSPTPRPSRGGRSSGIRRRTRTKPLLIWRHYAPRNPLRAKAEVIIKKYPDRPDAGKQVERPIYAAMMEMPRRPASTPS